MRVLFVLPYPIEVGSTRQRVFQYLPYLENKGVSCCTTSFVTSRFHRILYSRGMVSKKISFTVKGCVRRIRDMHIVSQYDMVFIQREAFPFGTTLVETRMSSKRPVIYDFDDAIYLMNPTLPSLASFLRKPSKIATILRLSDVVIAGNSYLADYACKYNKNVRIIPTSIDTSYYTPCRPRSIKSKIIIGWIGSRTTVSYLNEIKGVLRRLSKKYDMVLKIVANASINLGINTESKTWALTDELRDLRSFDIGIMPLPDDEWTRAKCGYKIIQYMAVGKPVVASPVGVNKEIVRDGYNGYLAQNSDEWEHKLGKLIEDERKRRTFGSRGRATVIEKYSLRVNAPILLSALKTCVT